ncbi:methyl-accepting chemotaxis protein [Bdellovibrio svalbardensis]|uniref:Methyl-accepting chemotaxis protein n=1 Tax=Bdellovibrio svalbardensis TaxID=2972972 RepID=A0ABT6DJN8_9BACT|nr:methyl-accepting chemotaxis protein [Bdellovibrio svalbardensis]MDG0816707.1 methyl-accepting chemotaxis protein [Bdellovibrio svalbardensis]
MNSLKSWIHGLRGKLLLSAFLPVFAFATITVIAMRGLDEIGTQLSGAYSDVIPNMEALGQMGMQRARVGYFIWASLSLHDDAKGRASFISKAEDAFKDFKKGQDMYEKQSFEPEEAKNYAKVKEHKEEFYQLTESIIADLKKNLPESDAKIKTLMNGGHWHILATDVQTMMAANIKLYSAMNEANNKKQEADRKTISQLLVLISAFCCFALFGILMWIAYRVSNSVGSIASHLAEVGTQVSGAISQLTSAGQTLSQASTESAASLEETVASLEEMSSMVKMNSDNAKQAAALSVSSRDAAEEGQREIQTLIASMHDISKSSKKIEEIISVIDDIAFQTNLLALNASVEAARAGEQGKGFAVVAEAVRALAQRSAVAAKDINVLIKESVNQVERGSDVADRSGETLNNIVNSVKKVSDLNNEISAASSEQTTGIQQISKAMNQLDQSTQANAASSEEIAASSEEISAQTQQMQNLTVNLNRVILGGAAEMEAQRHTKTTPAPAKVVPFKPRTATRSVGKKPHSAAATIPFDDDSRQEGLHRKVGTTDGF